MADKVGYRGAIDATGAPIPEDFVDNSDGTYAVKVSASGGGGSADFGTAVTGESLETGGAGNLGWLSSVRKNLGAWLGALTETVPATDTASSGLNGRLQRIAQRLTSLIGVLPATIGAKAKAAALGIAFATDQVGTAGTPSADVLSVQGVTGGTVLPTLESARAASTADVHAPASNTAAIITYAAAGAGVAHVIGGIAWSYAGGDPTGGNIKIEDGSGTTVFTVDITSKGPGFFIFPRPKKGTANTAMIVTLAAGGSGVTGKINATAHWTE